MYTAITVSSRWPGRARLYPRRDRVPWSACRHDLVQHLSRVEEDQRAAMWRDVDSLSSCSADLIVWISAHVQSKRTTITRSVPIIVV